MKELKVDDVIDKIVSSHSNFLETLKEHQPLIVLASLSLVIAGFSENISDTAPDFAIGASICFILALISSLLYSFMKPWSRNLHLLLIVYSGVSLGFIFFLLIVWTFIELNWMGSTSFIITSSIAIEITFGLVAFSSYSTLKKIKEEKNYDNRKVKRLFLLFTFLPIIGFVLFTVCQIIFDWYIIYFGSSPLLIRMLMMAGFDLIIIPPFIILPLINKDRKTTHIQEELPEKVTAITNSEIQKID